MAKRLLAILLCAGAATTAQANVSAEVQGQPTALPVVTLQPAVDTAAQRNTLKRLATCIANLRPTWARQTLALPYLSETQANEAAAVVAGRDNCFTGSRDQEVVFRTSSMVGNLAEHFLSRNLSESDFPRVTRVLARLEPRNSTEDFALCLAARDPISARALALSEIGSAGEREAAEAVAEHLGFCTNPGESLEVDMQAMRSLVATALYRGLTTEVAAR